MDDILEHLKARLYVCGAALGMLEAAFGGWTLDRETVQRRAMELLHRALAGF